MNKKILLIAMILGLVAILPFLSRQANLPDEPITGYPWQIELHADGLSSVFGLTLGRSTLAEARRVLGEGMKLALLSADRGDDSVELYYGHYTAGRLSGRLIIVADLATDVITGMRQRAQRAGGANTFRIHADDLPAVLQAPVKTITFIPLVDLDKDIVIQRFGKPHEIINRDNKLSHYLYPQKGLDLILDNEGKEVLQYVAPRDFTILRTPLNNMESNKGI